MENFPPNSDKSKEGAKAPKRVERVTSGNVVRRRRPLGKQFKSTFFGGDAKNAGEFMVFHVLIPAAKEAIVEAMSSGFERLVYGDSRPRRGNPYGNSRPPMAYNRRYQHGPETRPDDRPPLPTRMSRQARSRHDFGELVLPTRQDAEEVVDRLFDLISKYETATVADLYELTGLQSSHVDQRWGWTDLRGASVGRVRGGGYLLNLPEPESLG